MGTVTKTIGSAGGRDYSTLQAWEDALPANLVTDGNSQVGQCFNDSEFVSGGSTTILTIGGETTDSTHTITLTTGSGQSFRDNASVQSNALRYNQSNGVGISISAYGAGIKNSAVGYVTVDGLQIKAGATTYDHCLLLGGVSNVGQNCIIQAGGSSQGLTLDGINSIARNCLVSSTSGSAVPGINFGNSGLLTIANCTVVRPSDAAQFGNGGGIRNTGNYAYSGVNNVVNTAIFGFGSFTDNASHFGTANNNNCTDLGSVAVTGTGNLVSKTYANQFQNTTTASADFRAKSGADLIDAGATDTTDIPAAVDIAKTSRPSGSAWDIGAWELVTAGPSFISAWALQTNLPVIGTGTY